MNEFNDEYEKALHELNEQTDEVDMNNQNDEVEEEIVTEQDEELIEIFDEEEVTQDEKEKDEEVVVEEKDEEVVEETKKVDVDSTVLNRKDDQSVKPKSTLKTVLVALLCFILAFVGGLGGSILGNHLTKNDKTVLYQSVKHEVQNTNSSQQTLSIKEVAKIASVSVVEIQTETMSTSSFFQQAISSGAGSGVILTKDGYVVTNHHVIDGANKITVTTSDGVVYDATLIGSDAATDLAVLKIEATDLTPATLGYSESLVVGDSAIAIGNPLGELGGTVTSGIISALDREITIDNQTMHLLQTSAAINPGNSGGGLFNDQGHLIGIVNAKSSGSDIEGLGFAIPIDKAKPIIDSIIQHGYVKGRPSLGIMLQSSAAYDNSKANIYIARINPNEACDRAGLQVGDQILEFGGEVIDTLAKLKDVLSTFSAGEQVEMKVLRQNEIVTVTITLDDASESSNNQPTQQDTQSYPTQNYDVDDEFDIFDFFR